MMAAVIELNSIEIYYAIMTKIRPEWETETGKGGERETYSSWSTWQISFYNVIFFTLIWQEN